MIQSWIRGMAIVASTLVAVAAAVEPPQPKPGLWDIRMQHALDGTTDVKPTTMRPCLDASEQAQRRLTAANCAKKNCSKNETRREGKWVTGDTAYHTESTSTFDPPKPDHPRSVTIRDGKWLGVCQP